MNRIVLGVMLAALVSLWGATAGADVCEKCRGVPRTEDTRQCDECKGWTASGRYKICPKCSKKLGECECCRAKLKGAAGDDKVKTPDALTVQPASKPAEIDTDKSGQYKSGDWEYALTISAKGTRSERRIGRLSYDGKEVPAAEGINDYYVTPWGSLHWTGDHPFGPSGWVPPTLMTSNRMGKELPSPEKADQKQLVLGEKSDGKTVEVAQGTKVYVLLAGNPTTGYNWSLGSLDGNAVRLDGKIEYLREPRPGIVGSGGTFVAVFDAVQPGTAKVRLEYRRPWEKDKPAAKTFSVALEVKADKPASQPATRPAQAARPAEAAGAPPIAVAVKVTRGAHAGGGT